jgi:hypothetical protein
MFSKPKYFFLTPDEGAHAHLFAANGSGAEAVERVRSALSGEANVVGVLHHGAEFPLAQNGGVTLLPDAIRFEAELRQRIRTAPAGLTLYLAGPETFLWQAATAARAEGLHPRRIRMELTEPVSRQVYCVHCKSFTSGATTTLLPCSGCGLTLFVRDHFSARLAAYAGVRADAEAPGILPEAIAFTP